MGGGGSTSGQRRSLPLRLSSRLVSSARLHSVPGSPLETKPPPLPAHLAAIRPFLDGPEGLMNGTSHSSSANSMAGPAFLYLSEEQI